MEGKRISQEIKVGIHEKGLEPQKIGLNWGWNKEEYGYNCMWWDMNEIFIDVLPTDMVVLPPKLRM